MLAMAAAIRVASGHADPCTYSGYFLHLRVVSLFCVQDFSECFPARPADAADLLLLESAGFASD